MSGCQRELAAAFCIGIYMKNPAGLFGFGRKNFLKNNVESVDKNKYSCYYKKTERTLFYK